MIDPSDLNVQLRQDLKFGQEPPQKIAKKHPLDKNIFEEEQLQKAKMISATFGSYMTFVDAMECKIMSEYELPGTRSNYYDLAYKLGTAKTIDWDYIYNDDKFRPLNSTELFTYPRNLYEKKFGMDL